MTERHELCAKTAKLLADETFALEGELDRT